MSSYIPIETYKRFGESIVSYLRSRYHTETPHISVLHPENRGLLERIFRPQQQTLLELAEDGTELDEELFEFLDPTKIRSASTFGVRAVFKDFKDESSIKFKAGFYFRTAPKTEFRRATVEVTIVNLSRTSVKISIFDDDDGECIFEEEVDVPLQTSSELLIPVGLSNVAERAAEIVRNSLYENGLIIPICSEEAVCALSTSKQTSNGQVFHFRGRLGRARELDSERFKAVQNFIIEIRTRQKPAEGADSVEVTFVLRYIAPALLDSESDNLVVLEGSLYPTYIYDADRRGRWSVHYLMEVEGRLSWRGCTPSWSWKRKVRGAEFVGLYNLTPIGCLAVEESNESLVLRDWHIESEQVPAVRTSDRPLEDSLQQGVNYASASGIMLSEESLRLATEAVSSALRRIYGQNFRLYEFQERSLAEGLRALARQEHTALVLQARTAGGKTLAFLLPLLVWCVARKVEGDERVGVKVLMFYPTIALQNDQASLLLRLLWWINRRLTADEYSPLTFGVLHGYTEMRTRRMGDYNQPQELRLVCPLCSSRLELIWESCGSHRREVIRCINSSCALHDPRSSEGVALQEMMRMSREAIYSSPPDFLIASPDIINQRLIMGGEEDPSALTVLGKSVRICTECGWTHDYQARKCKKCRSTNLENLRPAHPVAVVVDEAHLLRGAFGAQVAYILTRIEQAVRIINNLQEDWRPVYFISSATLNNPRERARELIATDNVQVISAEEEVSRTESAYRVHLFIMPRVYSPEATVGRFFEAMYSTPTALEEPLRSNLSRALIQSRSEAFSERPNNKPYTLVFVNRISEANDLLNFAKLYAPDTPANGHTTDFGVERAKIEDEFSRGRLNILIATRGLEVGVDFGRVDVGIIYGMPYYISDYTQRIGRIGRRLEKHSIIVNVFMPDKPIDYFYYTNWRLLCDGSLRERHMQSEAYRINRGNVEAARRSAWRAVLDYISVQPNAEQIVNESVRRSPLPLVLLENHSKIIEYVRQALRIGGYLGAEDSEMEALRATQNFAQILRDGLENHLTIRGTLRSARFQELRTVRNLRTVEPEVRYEFSDGVAPRERGLSYAFRHCLRGQVVSYRGDYFIVGSTDRQTVGLYPRDAGGEEL